jgi:hypothetical protein
LANFLGGQPKVIPEFTGLQINTAVQVLPIPIPYGSPRVSVNLIYYNAFYSLLANEGGGKGILSGGKGAQEVEYFASIIMAIGEGEMSAIWIIYQDQDVWTPTDWPAPTAFFFNGTPTQAPWDYVVDNFPADARPYKSVSYYGIANAQLDASATVPQFNLVPAGILRATSPLNNSTIAITTGQYYPNGDPVSFIGDINIGDADADPAQVIYDFLTNATYGATFPQEFIDTTTLFTTDNGYNPAVGDGALSTYCQAVGLAWSTVINNAESAANIIDRWCKNLNVAPVWNGALLSFVPYWDAPASGNPGYDPGNPFGIRLKYFSPYTLPVVAITLDHILQSEGKGEDPIVFLRKDPLEVYNTVRVDFKDRNNFFNDNTVEAKDEAHVELYGPRIDNIGLANEFTLDAYANIAATMILRRNIAIMRNFTWKMGPLWGWLDPMMIVSIPDPTNYANTILVRIQSIEDDEDENITITAEEFYDGPQSPTTFPTSATSAPNQGATNIPPSEAYPPVIFAPTAEMLTALGIAVPTVFLGTSGGANTGYQGALDPNWGGAYVWVSLDDVTYQQIGQQNQPSTIGTLIQPLPGYGGANPDMTDTVYVDLNECNGTLPSVSNAVAAAGGSVFVLQDVSGFELLSYTTATLVGPYTYALTGLYRGLYGTFPRLFGAGSRFLACGSTANFFQTILPPGYVGLPFYIKLQSFNRMRTFFEELSEATAYTYVATGTTPVGPIPPPSQTATYRRQSRAKSKVRSRRQKQ